MGKSSLIIVLGMSVIIAFFILRLNATSKENVSTTMNMFEQTQARLIANSGVEVYLEMLKHDRDMMGKTYNGNSLFGGNFDVSISGPDSMVLVTSTAKFMDATHVTVVEAAADKVPFYPGPGAMYLSAGTVAGLKKNAINGSIEINGNDHNLSGDQNGGNVLPGIAVDGVTQQTAVIDMITKNTIDQVIGSGGEPSVVTINNEIDWGAYAQLLADNPDILINTQDKIKDSQNIWGTVEKPLVTFINGDITINNSQAASGCGILVVNGNLTINGGFDYKGMVIAFKDTKIDITLNGTATILGSMVVAGNEIGVDVSSGNFSALYSTEALNLIKSLLATKRFTILSWWE